jgi:hypothetical protein
VLFDVDARLSDVAQAMFRLRQVGKGQTVVLVVAGASVKSTLHGAELLAMLEANERAYREAAAVIRSRHVDHASKVKSSSESFMCDVQMDVELRQQQKQQTQQQQKTTEQLKERLLTGGTCLTSDTAVGTCGRYRTLDNKDATRARMPLMALRIGLSPMITCTRLRNQCGEQAMRRVFALRVAEDGAEKELVVMTIVEAFASDEDRSRYSVYTQDGAPMPLAKWAQGKGDGRFLAGKLLFGRFLCDGELSLLEEIELLKHLRCRYTTDAEREALREVMTCFVGSHFVTKSTILLHRLATETPDAVLVDASNREPGKFTCIAEQLLSKHLVQKAPACAME